MYHLVSVESIFLLQQWSAGVFQCREGMHRKPIYWWSESQIDIYLKLSLDVIIGKSIRFERNLVHFLRKVTKTCKHSCFQLSTATVHSQLEAACSLPSVSWRHQKARLSKNCLLSISGHFLQAGAHSEVATAASIMLRATAWADYITS